MSITDPLFVPGQLYHRRRDIHARFRGQQQGGMITPAKRRFIILVTGISGRQHGYEDRWSDDGSTFFYFGEGQVGDMRFTKGNLALRDHVSQGKDVHLFEAVPTKRGYLRYKGLMTCIGFEVVSAPDRFKKTRRAIRFELVPFESFLAASERSSPDPASESDHGLEQEGLDELRRKAISGSAECRTPVERRTLYRLRSRAVRLYVLRRAAGKCEGCGGVAPFTTRDGDPYLEPHHIRRLTDGGPDDPRWVVGVCPNCHRRAHYSRDAAEYNSHLAETVKKLEARDL